MHFTKDLTDPASPPAAPCTSCSCSPRPATDLRGTPEGCRSPSCTHGCPGGRTCSSISEKLSTNSHKFDVQLLKTNLNFTHRVLVREILVPPWLTLRPARAQPARVDRVRLLHYFLVFRKGYGSLREVDLKLPTLASLLRPGSDFLLFLKEA